MPTANRRPGLSLTEVLVALFIMAIGAISILTLFPLGALNMAQAFKDDRSTQAADQAEGFLRWYWRDRITDPNPPPPPPRPETFFPHMINPANPSGPDFMFAQSFNDSRLTGIPADQPGWPVVIDPMGIVARTGPSRNWLGDGGQTRLRRDTLALIEEQMPPRLATDQRATFALRTCTLLDGLGYSMTGVPDVTTGAIERDLRYNWLWVVQAPASQRPQQADIKVVVFDKRTHLFAPPGSEIVYVPADATPDNTFMQFNATDNPGGLPFRFQKGGWIMDATVTVNAFKNGVEYPGPAPANEFAPPDGPTEPPPTPITIVPGVRNAKFYQIVSVTEQGADVLVELNKAIEPDTVANVANRRIMLMPGIAHVFEPSRRLGE